MVTITRKGQVNLERLLNDAKQRALAKISGDMRALHCPTHHQGPSVNRTRDGKLEIQACCTTFKNAVIARLKH